METNRLRQFSVVAETQHLREAAEILGISHSALSKSLKVLEDQVGYQLLVSEGRGIALSDAGELLARRIPDLLLAFDTAIDLSTSTSSTALRIGTFEVFSTYFLGWFLESSPVEVSCRELIPGELESALAENKIDVGITYLPIPRAGLEFIEICRVPVGIVGQEKFAKNRWESLPFVAPGIPLQGTPTQVQGLDGWPEHEFPRKIKYRVDMMESALEMCRRGLAVMYLPLFVAALHNEMVKPHRNLKQLPHPPKMDRLHMPVFLVKRRSQQETKAMRELAKQLRKLKKLTV